MSHTPGPWIVLLPDMDYQKPLVKRGMEGGFAVMGLSKERELADAYLIAAAPDMLAALEAAFQELDEKYGHGLSNGYWPDIKPLHEQMRAAIKKARGE